MIEDEKIGVILSIFKELDKENIRYAVLRNYENLPERPLEGSDIDFLIDKKDEEKYSISFKNAVLKSGNFILFKIRQSNCLSYFVYQKKPFPLGTWIDAFWEISTKGFNFANSKYLLEKRLRHEKGFFIPSSGGEAATLFLKEIFSQGFIREKYLFKIPILVKREQESFIETLEPYFNKKTIQEMLQICLNEKWEEALKKRKKWLKSLILNIFLKNPINQTLHFFNFVFSQFKKFFIQKGLIVAVVGPDGVGKTTICQGLAERMKNLYFSKIYQYHSHFGFFPELGRIYSLLFRKQFLEKENTLSQEKPIGLARATLHIFYYGLEYFLAWPLVFWLKMRGNLIIFDRYFYDFIATNTHRKIPLWLFSIVAKIIPRPDLVFIIKARPEIIYGRKKDLTLKEIKRQLEAFQNLRILRISSFMFIDGEEAPNAVLNKIEDEFLKMLAKEYGEK